MKKIIIISIFTLTLLLAGFTAYSQYPIKRNNNTSNHSKKGTQVVKSKNSSKKDTSRLGKKKTLKKNDPIYAFYFYKIPFFGENLTLGEIYPDIKNQKKVRKINVFNTEEDWAGDELINMEFDKNGKLIFKEVIFLGDGRWEANYKYDTNGQIKTIELLYKASSDGIGPLVNAIYNYVWKNGKVHQIEETLNIDEGINYIGKPTHLEIIYDSNGKPNKAVCKENPRIFYKFNSKGQIKYYSTYAIYSDYYFGDNFDFEKGLKKYKDHEWYASVKVPLSWMFVDGEYSQDYDLDFEPPISAIYTFDEEGNWKKAKWFGQLEFDGNGYITVTRDITYDNQ